jgi:hypothetical protein
MFRNVGALALALAGIAPASAQHRPPQIVFSCTVRNGKTVSVTDRAGSFTYRYGTARAAQLTIAGDARSDNLHFMRQRYAGPETQLRFSRGAYNYIVYAMEGNGRTGARAVSGLLVMRGDRHVQDLPCRRYAEFRTGFDDLDGLPQDSETYSAM